jgi:transcription elongation factor
MLLEMAITPMTIASGSWVRITKSRRHEGDLALVEDVSEELGTARILLVPRIPLVRKRNKGERAKPTLFDSEVVMERYGADAVTRRNRLWVFRDRLYKDGLLSMNFALHRLSDRFVDATQDELALFRRTHNEWVVKAVDSVAVPLQINDRIQVVAGPHRGLSGYLTDIRDNHTATFESHLVPAPLQVMVRELRKLFNLGDRVKVVYGEHQSAEGFIVEMGDVSATIYTPDVVKNIDTLHW